MLHSWVASDQLPIGGLQQLGAIGAILSVTFTFFWIAYRDMRKQRDDAVAENRRLNDVILEVHKSTLPVLDRTSAALTESSRALTIYEDRRRP